MPNACYIDILGLKIIFKSDNFNGVEDNILPREDI
jgi:hypothetical protein